MDDRNILLDDETILTDEETEETSGSIVREYIDHYCDNLVNPDPEKCISPKALYITIGAAALGSVLVFLLIGWLLCYCPLKTTGFSAEDFIREYNAIVSDADVNDMIENNVAAISTAVSGSDISVLYPDFSDLTIPEDANLEKGVSLCGGDIILKADLLGGNIMSLEATVSDSCEKYDFEKGYFPAAEGIDADYSTFQHYAAVGKARLALYNLICKAEGTETTVSTLNDAVNYGVVMENFAYYVYSVYGTYDPTIVYSESGDTCTMTFDSSCFRFSADTIQKTVIPTDNGIYRFFDSIFGEKPEEEPEAESIVDDAYAPAVSSSADVSDADVVSAADTVSAADAQ